LRRLGGTARADQRTCDLAVHRELPTQCADARRQARLLRHGQGLGRAPVVDQGLCAVELGDPGELVATPQALGKVGRRHRVLRIGLPRATPSAVDMAQSGVGVAAMPGAGLGRRLQ
jgi:hypothetical protein